MNWILHYTIYVYLLGSTIGDVKSRRQLNFIKGLFDMFDTKIPTTITHNNTSTEVITKSSVDTTPKHDEKEVKRVVEKMLLIASTRHKCDCNCSKKSIKIETSTIKEDKIINNTSNSVEKSVLKRSNPEKRDVTNRALSNICPYIVPNEGFKMDKMVDVLWSKFYNMEDPLSCFNINIKKLTDMQKRSKEFSYGTFGGKVDWSRCHFEIQPPDAFSNMRHFLLGDASDLGVMRNIIIKADSNGVFILEEEPPDQWIMLDKLLILRDCMTGEVVVFTRDPQATAVSDVVLVLQNLGEQMIGKMLCDENDIFGDNFV